MSRVYSDCCGRASWAGQSHNPERKTFAKANAVVETGSALAALSCHRHACAHHKGGAAHHGGQLEGQTWRTAHASKRVAPSAEAARHRPPERRPINGPTLTRRTQRLALRRPWHQSNRPHTAWAQAAGRRRSQRAWRCGSRPRRCSHRPLARS